MEGLFRISRVTFHGLFSAALLLLRLLPSLCVDLMKPYLDWRFPRLTLAWNVLDQAAWIQAEAFGKLNVIIV